MHHIVPKMTRKHGANILDGHTSGSKRRSLGPYEMSDVEIYKNDGKDEPSSRRTL